MAADNPYKSKRQTGYGWTRPSNTGEGPYTPEHPSVVPITPPVKKISQLPNVFDVGNKLEAIELHKLQQWAATGSASGKAALRDYEGKIERSLQKRAEDNGYINFDVREYIPKWINHWIFGEDDQALIPNHGDKDEHGNTPRPTPDGQPIQPLPGPFKA